MKAEGANMMLSNDEFVSRLTAISPDIEPLSKYAGLKNKVNVRCKKCGNLWSPQARALLEGKRCPSCAGVQRKTHQQFVSELTELNPTIEPLEEYAGANTRITFHCKVCNESWMTRPHSILSGGTGCPNCSRAGTSFFEKALFFALSDLLGKESVVSRDRKTLGKELDIFIPSLSLAYEPGSWYYHKRRLDVDKEKRLLCRARGIRLMTIYSGCPDGIEAPFDEDCIVLTSNLGVSCWDEVKCLIERLLDDANLKSGSIDWDSVRKRAVVYGGRMTTAQFASQLKEINPNLEMLGEYQSARTKTKVRCRLCGHVWEVTPDSLLRGHGCRNCANIKMAEDRRKPRAELIKEIAIVNPTIVLIGDYINTDTRTLTKCLTCGYIWDAFPSNLLRGEGCPNCQGNRKRTNEEFVAELAEKNPRVKALQPYVNRTVKLLVECTECEHRWKAGPSDLLRGRGCPICGKERSRKARQKTHEQFVAQLAIANSNIEAIGQYEYARTKMLFRCLLCGNEWSATPDNILRGRKCPACHGRSTH